MRKTISFKQVVQCNDYRRVGTSNIRHGNCKRDIDKVGARPEGSQHYGVGRGRRLLPFCRTGSPARLTCARSRDAHGCRRGRLRYRAGAACETPRPFPALFDDLGRRYLRLRASGQVAVVPVSATAPRGMLPLRRRVCRSRMCLGMCDASPCGSCAQLRRSLAARKAYACRSGT
jgi:hypothetical protein